MHDICGMFVGQHANVVVFRHGVGLHVLFLPTNDCHQDVVGNIFHELAHFVFGILDFQRSLHDFYFIHTVCA
tara:strand:- start:9927 stop:10142 length:216 start_codon:yes stop_codon:yes gene_type:complete